MANSHKSLVTQIQADEKLLLANRRAMDKVQLQFQCKCAHRDANGSFALSVPSGPNSKKSSFTGLLEFRKSGQGRCSPEAEELSHCKALRYILRVPQRDVHAHEGRRH